MSERRRVVLLITPEEIRDALGLPDDVQVLGVRFDFVEDIYEVALEGRRLPLVVPGAVVRRATLKEVVEIIEADGFSITK